MIRDVYSYFKYVKSGMFSQHGEDLFLNDFFKNQKQGFYIDIGASHPFRISNTYSLYRKGWQGIVVDPISHFEPLYKIWRKRDTFVNLGIGSSESTLTYYELTPSVLSSFDEEYVNNLLKNNRATINKKYKVLVKPVNAFLSEYADGKIIDFLSLDVEGLDYEILSAVDFDTYRPRIICVEFNNDVHKNDITQLLEKNGYNCSKIIGCNIMAIDKKSPPSIKQGD